MSDRARNKLGLDRRDTWMFALGFVVYSVTGIEKARRVTSLAGAFMTLGLVYVLIIGACLLSFYVSGGQLSRTGRTLVLSFAACLLAGLGAAASWNGAHDRRVADDLRRDGVEVTGEVIDHRGFEGQARVVFETDEEVRVDTWVTASRYFENGPRQIRYLRSNPHVARLVDDPVPRTSDLSGLIFLYVFCGLVALALGAGFRAIDRSLGLRPR
jgi:hypothetical protein